MQNGNCKMKMQIEQEAGLDLPRGPDRLPRPESPSYSDRLAG